VFKNKYGLFVMKTTYLVAPLLFDMQSRIYV